MKDDKNIDKLFREKLEGFSEMPPHYVWDGLSDQLRHGRNKRRAAWYSWSAVAALVLLAFLAGWYFNESMYKVAPVVVETEKQINQQLYPENFNKETNAPPSITDSNNEPSLVRNMLVNADTNESIHIPSAESIAHENESDETSVPKRGLLVIPSQLEPRVAVLIAQNETYIPAEIVSTVNKSELTAYEQSIIANNSVQLINQYRERSSWQMGVSLSPGYSSYAANHNAVYASNMTRETSDGHANLSGGLSVKYKTSGRWSIESGVYYAQNGQQSGIIPNIPDGRAELGIDSPSPGKLFFNSALRMENNNMAMNSTAGVIAFNNLPAGAELAANLEGTFTTGNTYITEGELSQIFDFIEIPLYMRYLLVDSKLDVELVGGFSTGLIVGNNAFLESNQGIRHIGRTQDISTINFSSTVGVGLNYALNKNFSLGVEPRLNYYLRSINRSPDVDFKPYRVGVFTGLYYTF